MFSEVVDKECGLRPVTAQAGQVFNDDRFDLARFDHLIDFVDSLTVEVHTADIVIEGFAHHLVAVADGKVIYDESRAVLTTYLYPHLKGRMTRWLEQNIGCMALSKDEMAAVRQAQRLYHVAWKDTGEIAEELGISEARVSRYVRYNTHFLGVHDLVPEGYDGDPYERLMPGMLSVSAERAVYRKVCIELLRELFDTLPKKDRDILGKTCGVFGYPEATLKEIGMYHMMKESAVEKAKNRAVEKLREAYPGSRLQVWRAVHRMLRRPVPPPGEDRELRRNFPQYVRALAEVYGVLSEAASDINNISV